MRITLHDVLVAAGDPDGTRNGFADAIPVCEFCLAILTFKTVYPTRTGFYRCGKHLFGLEFRSPGDYFAWQNSWPEKMYIPTSMMLQEMLDTPQPPFRARLRREYREISVLKWMHKYWFDIYCASMMAGVIIAYIACRTT